MGIFGFSVGIMTSVVQPLSSSKKKTMAKAKCANLIVICQFFITIKHFGVKLKKLGVAQMSSFSLFYRALP